MKSPSKKQLIIFSLLWAAYASAYFLRKPFGIIKISLQESFELSENSLGYIDLAFSLPYAFVSLFLGKLADTTRPRIILGCGLIGSALASSVMGLMNNYVMFLILLFISGAFQSLTWPAACSILSTWFSKKTRTSLMGVFGTSLLAGSICGAILTVFILNNFGWRHVFYIPSVFVGIMGMFALFFAKSKEHQISDGIPESKELNDLVEVNRSLNFWQVFCLPTVPLVSVSIFCVKGIRNAVLFWLPFYLTSVLDYSEKAAGLVSLTFEIGGFLGSVALTILVDKCLRHKDLLAMSVIIFLCGLTSVLMLLTQSHGVFFLYASLFFSGAFSSTAEIMGSGSLPTKIGEKFGARASVTGVINGIGSLGNVVEGPIVAWLSYSYGIKSLVPFIAIMSLIGSSACLVAMWKENKNIAATGSKTVKDIIVVT